MCGHTGKDGAAPDSEKPNLDMLLHDVDTVTSGCGITKLGTLRHLCGGRFVLRSSSDSAGENGLVYDHPMIFSGHRAEADVSVGNSSSPSRVVIKALAEDSAELMLVHKLHGDPDVRVVPVIALLNAFTVYGGRRMRAVCMPLMPTLAEAIWPGNRGVLECDIAVTSTARQLLQVVSELSHFSIHIV